MEAPYAIKAALEGLRKAKKWFWSKFDASDVMTLFVSIGCVLLVVGLVTWIANLKYCDDPQVKKHPQSCVSRDNG